LQKELTVAIDKYASVDRIKSWFPFLHVASGWHRLGCMHNLCDQDNIACRAEPSTANNGSEVVRLSIFSSKYIYALDAGPVFEKLVFLIIY